MNLSTKHDPGQRVYWIAESTTILTGVIESITLSENKYEYAVTEGETSETFLLEEDELLVDVVDILAALEERVKELIR